MMERIPNSNFRIPNLAIGIAAIIVCLLAGSAFWRRTAVDPSLTAFVRRGPLTARLTTTVTTDSMTTDITGTSTTVTASMIR